MSYCNRPARQRQRCIEKQVEKADANGFFTLLSDQEIGHLIEAQLPAHRESKYPPTLTLSMFLGQVLSADSSCQNAVNEANVTRLLNAQSAASSQTGGYCLARQRLPLTLVKSLVEQIGERLSEHTSKGWLWRGREVKLVDGTTILMPDSEDNQYHYPQHANQAPGVGFALARVVGIMSLSTAAVLAAAMAPNKGKGTGEHGLFRQIKGACTEGDVLLGDSYYCSYFLIAEQQSRGVDVVFEQHGARRTDFRRGEQLGVRDHRVSWCKPARPEWMSQEDYAGYPAELKMREVKVGKKILVSTFLMPKEVSKNALGKLFWQRWHVELDLRNIKSTLGMETLSCKTAAMCEKELWVYFLAYNLIRLLMAEAALQAGALPRELSFKHTLQLWLSWSRRQFLTPVEENTDVLFMLIAQVRVGQRPNRIEPRAIKRRPKPYRRLQKSRQQERDFIKKKGHGRKLAA